MQGSKSEPRGRAWTRESAGSELNASGRRVTAELPQLHLHALPDCRRLYSARLSIWSLEPHHEIVDQNPSATKSSADQTARAIDHSTLRFTRRIEHCHKGDQQSPDQF